MSPALLCVIAAANIHLDYLSGALYEGEELTICLRFENRTRVKARASCEVELRSGEKWTVASSRRRDLDAGGSWVFSGNYSPKGWRELAVRAVGAEDEAWRMEVLFLREGERVPPLAPRWWNLYDEQGRAVVPITEKRVVEKDRTWYWPRKLARELDHAPAGHAVVVGERNAPQGSASYLDILSRSKSPRISVVEYGLPGRPCHPVLAAAAAVSRLNSAKKAVVAVVALPWADPEMGTPLRLYSRLLDFMLVTLAAKKFGRAVFFPPVEGPRAASYVELARRSCEAYRAACIDFDLPRQLWLTEMGKGRLSRPGPRGQERMARQVIDSVE